LLLIAFPIFTVSGSLMRGSLVLFSNLFEQPVSTTQGRKKGRSSELHAKRNECLVDRYFYYLKFAEARYDIALQRLSEEFFISPFTIPDILNDNITMLRDLKKNNPSKSWFKSKWPHLNW
jgi:hypothetical protein